MEENGGGNLFELFCGMIEAFNPCMDDYLYVFDVQNDQYYISKKAMKRFALPSFQFTHVLDTHRKFVYEEDIEMLEADLEKVMSGENLEHNLTYRWMSVDGEPIWMAVSMRSEPNRLQTMSADCWRVLQSRMHGISSIIR